MTTFQEHYYLNQKVGCIYSSALVKWKDGNRRHVVLTTEGNISVTGFDPSDGVISTIRIPLDSIRQKNRMPIRIYAISHLGQPYLLIVLRSQDVIGSVHYIAILKVDLIESSILHFEVVNESFRLSYCPLDITTATLNETEFVLITGDDNRFHSYEIDEFGQLHRGNKKSGTIPRESIISHWESRLQSDLANSYGLRLFIEEWPGGSQGIVGYANGFFFWDLFPASAIDELIMGANEGKQSWLDLDSTHSHVVARSDRLGRTRYMPPPPVPLTPSRKASAPDSPFSRSMPATPVASSTPAQADAMNPLLESPFAHGIALDPDPLSPAEAEYNSMPHENAIASPPKPPESLSKALLLEGSISCLLPFSVYRRNTHGSVSEFLAAADRAAQPSMSMQPPTFCVAIGTTHGIASIVSLKLNIKKANPSMRSAGGRAGPETGDSANPGGDVQGHRGNTATVNSVDDADTEIFEDQEGYVVLPINGFADNGSVQAMAVGDVCMNGYDDIIIGYVDGTVRLFVREVPEPGCELELTFQNTWVINLGIPIMSVHFGSVMGERVMKGDQLPLSCSEETKQQEDGFGNLLQFADQLLVQTSESLHVYTATM